MEQTAFDDPPITGDEPSIDRCTSIDPDDLVGEMVRVPAELAYWNSRLSAAHEAWLRAKFKLEQVEASVYMSVRISAENRNQKPTETTIRSMIMRDKMYDQTRNEYIVAEAERERLNNICKTIAVKKDMLMSINNRFNAELRSDPIARSSGMTR